MTHRLCQPERKASHSRYKVDSEITLTKPVAKMKFSIWYYNEKDYSKN